VGFDIAESIMEILRNLSSLQFLEVSIVSLINVIFGSCNSAQIFDWNKLWR